MNCRIKLFIALLFVVAGCQGYDDPSIQRTSAQGIVAMDEDELEGFSDEEIFQQQVSAGGGIEEGSKASWSASGVLFTGSTEEAVQLQADFTASGPYTLQFSLDLADGFLGNISVVAEIDWKVEGNWVHRVVSVRSGTAISGTAEACKVTIRNDLIVGVSQAYRVSVQLAMGTRGSNAQPPIYAPVIGAIPVAIPPALPVDVAIPLNCGVISIWMFGVDNSGAQPVAAAAGKLIGVFKSPFGIVCGYVDLTIPQWYPVPPAATIITIHNSTGASALVSEPLFGIEG